MNTAVFPGFFVSEIFGGLNNPVATRFASDGRVFIAEQAGRIKVFDSLSDPTPDVLVDLSPAVYGWWDRGLLGLAVHPDFPATPYIYALYTLDTEGYNDACPTPPGPMNDGCMADGRLSRFQVSAANTVVGSEAVLLQDKWCQQYPSHSIGDLVFGPDGALYLSAGDGASFSFVDYGQGGGDPDSPTPANPCGDPPVPVGGSQVPPAAEGGALRSQDVRTSGDPLSYDGAILRMSDAGTGEQVVAYGFRNPFRFTFRPGTSEIWIGDVGWNTWEEVDRLADPGGSVENFGWPCYEGTGRQPSYDAADLNICEDLYIEGSAQSPYWSYHHSPDGSGCGDGGYSITGVAFYNGGRYPDAYDGALFFGDHSRQCIRVMRPGAGGLPDPSTLATIMTGIGVVDIQRGPGGDLFLTDYDEGKVYRLEYNTGPTAVASAAPPSGTAPLTVTFDGSASTDAEGDALTYAWDLDNDGAFDDSTAVSVPWTFPNPGTFQAHLRVTDAFGATDTDTVTVTVTANQAPSATITTPSGSLVWTVGQTISFSGQGTDPEDGSLPASGHAWRVTIQHCVTPASCHSHLVGSFPGVKSGSFSAPDHEYPTYLHIELTVTDSGGITDVAAVDIYPQTTDLTFATSPNGLTLVVGTESGPAPFMVTAIGGGQVAVIAPSPQAQGGITYQFSSWSDGGAASHTITVPATDSIYTAAYVSSGGGGGGGGGGGAPSPVATFTDVPPSHMFFKAIEWLAAEEITSGCSPTTFCPDDPITREQMAAFLVRALGLTSGVGADYFTDDDSSPFEADIDRLRQAGITAGCNPPEGDHFCPQDNVTREQMAAFLVRALGLTVGVGTDYFTDDDGLPLEDEIDRLRAAGITAGCSPAGDLFCPFQNVTRGQMAAFLYRALSGQA